MRCRVTYRYLRSYHRGDEMLDDRSRTIIFDLPRANSEMTIDKVVRMARREANRRLKDNPYCRGIKSVAILA